MSITIQSIETTAADIFHAAIARFQQFGSAIAAAAKTADQVAEAAAPVATAVLAVVAPQDVAAVAAARALLNAADAAIEDAGAAAGSGVSLSLPAGLVRDWQAAKAALVAFEQSL
jgi:hypothetical protein